MRMTLDYFDDGRWYMPQGSINYCDGMELCHQIFDCQASAEPLDCDDGNTCTLDSCDALTGCANTPLVGCGDESVMLCSKSTGTGPELL